MPAATQPHIIGSSAAPFLVRHHLRVVEPASAAKSTCGTCAQCALSAICLPEGLSNDERQEFATLVFQPQRLRAGQTLFRSGDPFTHLHFVKTGSFKTVVLLDDGREQITGFHFAGDVLGIDAISSPSHASEAVALADAHVCAVSFAHLSRLSRRVESLQIYLQRLLAREVVRDQGLMLLLGRMHADERVVAFLQNLSRRFQARGCSPHEFTLPMAREDIGNFLGLTLETVSRCFSRLRSAGVIDVDSRRIRILDGEALQSAVGGKERAERKKNGMAGR